VQQTYFSKLIAVDVQRVEDLLNIQPVKALNYHLPNEVFAKFTARPKFTQLVCEIRSIYSFVSRYLRKKGGYFCNRLSCAFDKNQWALMRPF
jgi:hypothetical protein